VEEVYMVGLIMDWLKVWDIPSMVRAVAFNLGVE